MERPFLCDIDLITYHRIRRLARQTASAFSTTS